MVKLRFSIIKKKYKNGRVVYKYDQISLVFPRKFHGLVKCLRNHQLDIKASKEGKTTHITLIDTQDQ
jgi:hypothetical protein